VFVRKCHMDQIEDYLPDFEKYVSTYAKLLENAKPTEENVTEFSDFDKYMLKLDPVSGYMSSNFGKEFGEKYTNEFLFEYA
jgi:triacylglycerol esterase/lipase EstA (alpha/beta hydrolase family)